MPRRNFLTDPADFGAETHQLATPKEARLVLGLDLGTVTGYTFAYYVPGQHKKATELISPWHMGQLDLSAGPYESGAIRFVKLRHFLAAADPDAVFYEEVRYTPPNINKTNAVAVLTRIATAAELLGAFKSHVAAWCEEAPVPCTGFSIKTIKKRATGKGNAGKEMMIKACNETFGSNLEVEGYESSGTDNIADSAWCCLLGLEQYADGLS